MWLRMSKRRKRSLFARFSGIFGLIVVLFLGGIAAVAYLFTRAFGGEGPLAAGAWVAGLGLAFAMPALAGQLASRAFQDIATPLADVMGAADRVAAGDLSARVSQEGPGEFGQLARSFNRMTEELQRADRQRRNLTADVAHELRTPLQIIQGNLEGILDDVYKPTEEHIRTTLDETRLLARLVEDLQTLSLAEAGELPLVCEPVEDMLAAIPTGTVVTVDGTTGEISWSD